VRECEKRVRVVIVVHSRGSSTANEEREMTTTDEGSKTKTAVVGRLVEVLPPHEQYATGAVKLKTSGDAALFVAGIPAALFAGKVAAGLVPGALVQVSGEVVCDWPVRGPNDPPSPPRVRTRWTHLQLVPEAKTPAA